MSSRISHRRVVGGTSTAAGGLRARPDLRERPSIARRLPGKTPAAVEAAICQLRQDRKLGPRRLGPLLNRALIEYRDDLVRSRTQTVNRLHVLLAQSCPRAPQPTSPPTLRVRPRQLLARTHRQIAVDLVAEIRRLDRRLNAAGDAISSAVVASGCTLTQLYGVGDIVADILLPRTGPVSRFASPAHFASFSGVAPIEVSSGDVVGHRSARRWWARTTRPGTAERRYRGRRPLRAG
ncbi:transposase [Micromonospora echinaurantiaca]|uniref:transposase n=1 Tax=Micromonospora echinaurantiaca TaxID=47857 RepID=UPI0012FDE34E